MTLALDANTVIDFFKLRGRVAARMAEVPPGRLILPAVVAHELWTGVAKSPQSARRRQQLEEFLRVVAVQPFGPDEARISADVRAQLEAAGTPIGPLDTLIAGTALAIGATLVTRNTREFSRVPGLRLEDWY